MDGARAMCSMIFQGCVGPDVFSWIGRCVAEVCALPGALRVAQVIIKMSLKVRILFTELSGLCLSLSSAINCNLCASQAK